MGSRSGSLALNAAERLLDPLLRALAALGQLLRFAGDLLAAFLPQRRRRRLRPWMIVRRGRARAGAPELEVSRAEAERLLERMRQLDDTALLSERALGFASAGADHFADPRHVESLVAALIRENPPFLHIARDRPAPDQGRAAEVRTELLLRDTEVVVREPCTLFVPKVGMEHRESRRPPGYPVLRTAKTLSDLRAAPLLYQALPEDYLIARLVEGAVPVLAYREERRLTLFEAQERVLERRERRRTEVPVEIEPGGEGQGARLIYLLFDRSTSLVRNCAPRGVNAVMELAIAVAMLRADLGRPYARYYFRTFAERLFPQPQDPPLCAVTVKEKDDLVRRLFRTNFSGEATNVVEALETAADDIERIAQSGELGEGVRPRIGLLTDGRATIYRNVGARLKRLGIELDTVLIGREALHNPDLLRISSTVSLVDPALYGGAAAA